MQQHGERDQQGGEHGERDQQGGEHGERDQQGGEHADLRSVYHKDQVDADASCMKQMHTKT